MNRRSFLKKVFGSFIAVVGVAGGGYYYASEIEPKMLEINRQTLQSKKIPSSFNNFKIVQFSDTHVGFHYSVDQLKELVQTINAKKPDLIVFTGDLIDEVQTFNQQNQLIEVLKKLTAPAGKFWVYGNHDHGSYGTDIVRSIMDRANFKLLKNEHHFIKKPHAEIALIGVDDAILGVPNVAESLREVNESLFTILLAHEPDLADEARKYPIDVQFSGHSHGGQVQLPFVGHLYTPRFAKNYVEGKYTFPETAFNLHVNRGIGTTRLPFRLFCKPEVHVYTLKS